MVTELWVFCWTKERALWCLPTFLDEPSYQYCFSVDEKMFIYFHQLWHVIWGKLNLHLLPLFLQNTPFSLSWGKRPHEKTAQRYCKMKESTLYISSTIHTLITLTDHPHLSPSSSPSLITLTLTDHAHHPHSLPSLITFTITLTDPPIHHPHWSPSPITLTDHAHLPYSLP